MVEKINENKNNESRKEELQQAISDKINQLGLLSEAFINDVERVCRACEIILRGYDVDFERLDNEQVLILLAISDQWITSKERRLLDLAKILIVVPDYEIGRMVTGSSVINELSYVINPDSLVIEDYGKSRAKLFNPHLEAISDEEMNTSFRSSIYKKYDYVINKNNQNTKKTNALNEKASEWGEGAMLHKVRTKLGINEENQKPVSFVVLKSDKPYQSSNGLIPNYPFQIKVDESDPIVVINEGIAENDLYYHYIEHEYIHSQGILALTQFGILFMAIDEAITELNTSDPHPDSYNTIRYIFTEILAKHIDGIVDDFTKAYITQTIEDRIIPLQKIFNEYGSEVLVAILSASPITPDPQEIEYRRELFGELYDCFYNLNDLLNLVSDVNLKKLIEKG